MNNINSDPRMDGANFEVLMTRTMAIKDYKLYFFQN